MILCPSSRSTVPTFLLSADQYDAGEPLQEGRAGALLGDELQGGAEAVPPGPGCHPRCVSARCEHCTVQPCWNLNLHFSSSLVFACHSHITEIVTSPVTCWWCLSGDRVSAPQTVFYPKQFWVAEADVWTPLNRLALTVGEGSRSGLHDHQYNPEHSQPGLALCVDQGLRLCAYWRQHQSNKHHLVRVETVWCNQIIYKFYI